MARVVIVPGLAVRTYADPAAAALGARAHRVTLAPASAWRGQETDLAAYGRALARRIEQDGHEIDVLAGLSVGTQSAAVTAASTDMVRQLLLISPTVDPVNRSWRRLIARWLRGDPRAEDPPLREQAADWTLAGIPRIVQGLRSALVTEPLEEVVSRIDASLTVVHAEFDSLGGVDWAAQVADRGNGRLLTAPGAPHSWPYHDTTLFADLIDRMVG